MILGHFVALVLASLAALPSHVSAQDIVYDAEHNATTIVGTWSSGSKAVVTGSVSAVFRVLCDMRLLWMAHVGVGGSWRLTDCGLRHSRALRTQLMSRSHTLKQRVSRIHCECWSALVPLYARLHCPLLAAR